MIWKRTEPKKISVYLDSSIHVQTIVLIKMKYYSLGVEPQTWKEKRYFHRNRTNLIYFLSVEPNQKKNSFEALHYYLDYFEHIFLGQFINNYLVIDFYGDINVHRYFRSIYRTSMFRSNTSNIDVYKNAAQHRLLVSHGSLSFSSILLHYEDWREYIISLSRM